ncbi:MAG: PAS domain-containing protein [Succinivibrio sp.]|nr:PAS domain-containing protein [Succinivibrio sp.]
MFDEADALVESISTAVIVTDLDFQIVFANQAAEQFTGMSKTRLKTLRLTDLICSSEKSLLEALTEAKKPNFPGFATSSAKFSLGPTVTKLGNIWISVFIGGKSRGIIAEIRSSWRQEKLLDEFNQRDQHNAAQDLVRGLAHEIKNPLGGIRGAAQLIELSFPDTAGLKDYTTLIIEQTDRLKALVDKLLGPQRPNPMTQANIHFVIEKVVSLIQMETREQISIIKDYDPSLPEIMLDVDGMEQVLLNIVLNAVQALNEEQISRPYIRITSRAAYGVVINDYKYPTCIAISIENNGPEIPEIIRRKIFYPMVTTKTKGTGLGLSLAQNIVQRHQGIIECSSNSEHTLFRILLPLRPRRRMPNKGA